MRGLAKCRVCKLAAEVWLFVVTSYKFAIPPIAHPLPITHPSIVTI
jgi:hypothetical protein